MGCCFERQKFKFSPGDEFGDAYNKYVDIHAQLLDIIKSAEKVTEKAEKDPEAALDMLDKEMENMSKVIQVEAEKEQAFQNLETIYKKLKDSNQLGADETLKTEKYNEVLSMKEKVNQNMKKQAEAMQNLLNNRKNKRI